MGGAATIVITVTIVLGILSIISVTLRLYCRIAYQRSPLGPDDYCVILVWALSTYNCVRKLIIP